MTAMGSDSALRVTGGVQQQKRTLAQFWQRVLCTDAQDRSLVSLNSFTAGQAHPVKDQGRHP